MGCPLSSSYPNCSGIDRKGYCPQRNIRCGTPPTPNGFLTKTMGALTNHLRVEMVTIGDDDIHQSIQTTIESLEDLTNSLGQQAT
jgi:hypothetical protein